MKELPIGEVARRAGIRASAVRYYEGIGLLPEPRRVNGQRRYDPSVMGWLALIRLAQQAGFRVREIQALFHGFEADTPPSVRWRTLARLKAKELDALIERAQHMKDVLDRGLDCSCSRLEECVLLVQTK